MFLGLGPVVYQVSDLQEAKAWYAKVLGVQPYFDQPLYVGFQTRGCELGLVPVKGAKAKRRAAGIAYWRVEDARAAHRRLLDLGATEIRPVREVGDGVLVATVHDPFGNVLGIIEDPNFKAPGD